MTYLDFDPKLLVAKAIADGLIQTPEQLKEARKAESKIKARQHRIEYSRKNYDKRRIPKELHKKPGPKPKKLAGQMTRLNTASKLKKAKI